jgi:hypothetical protein
MINLWNILAEYKYVMTFCGKNFQWVLPGVVARSLRSERQSFQKM